MKPALKPGEMVVGKGSAAQAVQRAGGPSLFQVAHGPQLVSSRTTLSAPARVSTDPSERNPGRFLRQTQLCVGCAELRGFVARLNDRVRSLEGFRSNYEDAWYQANPRGRNNMGFIEVLEGVWMPGPELERAEMSKEDTVPPFPALQDPEENE